MKQGRSLAAILLSAVLIADSMPIQVSGPYPFPGSAQHLFACEALAGRALIPRYGRDLLSRSQEKTLFRWLKTYTDSSITGVWLFEKGPLLKFFLIGRPALMSSSSIRNRRFPNAISLAFLETTARAGR